MKKALVSCLLLIAFSSLFSQTFSLSGSNFTTGSYYRTYGIWFELGKPSIRPECFSLMDSISDFMKAHASLDFEIGVHSDSRGSDAANFNLTQARAGSIKDYLINKGVVADRLNAKGYGESKLLESDEKIKKLRSIEEIESSHQKNRRVEFIILLVREIK